MFIFLYMFHAYSIKIILTMLPKELDLPKTKSHNLYSHILFYLTLKPHNLYILKPYNLITFTHSNLITFKPHSLYILKPYNLYIFKSHNLYTLKPSTITPLDTYLPFSPITPSSHPHKGIQPCNHSLHSTKCVITTTT